MRLPLVLVTVALVILVAGLYRLVSVLDQVELALRAMVTSIRALRRALRQAAALAQEVGRDASAGEAALGALEDLKEPRTGRTPQAR